MGHLAADRPEEESFESPAPAGSHDDEVHAVGPGGRENGFRLRSFEQILQHRGIDPAQALAGGANDFLAGGLATGHQAFEVPVTPQTKKG